MNTPIAISHRPFAVDRFSGLMLPDGIFDTALPDQTLNAFVENTSDTDLADVSVYVEGFSDPGISLILKTFTFQVLRVGESRLCSWGCDFSAASVAKTIVSIKIQAKGFGLTRIIREIFVSKTSYDFVKKEYICRVPEGSLRLKAIETSGPKALYRNNEKISQDGPWLLRRFTMEIDSQFYGQFGPLAFSDPWWKVLALIIALICEIASIILASRGHGTMKVGVQCNYDETTGETTNCRSPDPEPTNGPSPIDYASILSGVAAGALGVALSDLIDPWRRGQEATAVAPDEQTVAQRLDVSVVPLDDLTPGDPYRVQCAWLYTRITDKRSYQFSAIDVNTNTHLLKTKQLNCPPKAYTSEDDVPFIATLKRPEGSPFVGKELLVSVVARPPLGGGAEFVFGLEDREMKGLYVGGFKLREAVATLVQYGDSYLGEWRFHIRAQNINLVPPGTDPLNAAQTIGGFVVAAPLVLSLGHEACPVSVPDALMEVLRPTDR